MACEADAVLEGEDPQEEMARQDAVDRHDPNRVPGQNSLRRTTIPCNENPLAQVQRRPTEPDYHRVPCAICPQLAHGAGVFLCGL